MTTAWAELLLLQDDVVRHDQALAHGFTRAQVRHRLGPGRRWQRVLPCVYATFTGELHEQHRLRAALLYAGEGAVLTGAAACRRYALRYVPDVAADTVDVLVPHRRHTGSRDFVRVKRSTVRPAVVRIRGIDCAAPERAVVDLALRLPTLRDVRAVVCEVVQRRLTLPERVAAAAAAAERRGRAHLAVAVGEVLAGCRSAPECDLRDVVRRSRLLPEPGWNQPLPDPRGAHLHPDACWPEARLVVEVDSREWHGYGLAPEETAARHATYARLGWRVVSLPPRRIRREPQAVRRLLEDAYRIGLDR